MWMWKCWYSLAGLPGEDRVGQTSHWSVTIMRRQLEIEVAVTWSRSAQAWDWIELEQHGLPGLMCFCLSCYVLVGSIMIRRKKEERCGVWVWSWSMSRGQSMSWEACMVMPVMMQNVWCSVLLPALHAQKGLDISLSSQTAVCSSTKLYSPGTI
jgi:hypothetical protein